MNKNPLSIQGTVFKDAPDWMGISSSEIYFSVPEVAKMFGVSEPTAYRWIYKGELKGVVFGRKRKVANSEIKRFIDSCNQPGTKLK